MNKDSKVVLCVTDHEGKQETQAYAGVMAPHAVASHLKWLRNQPDTKFAHATVDGDAVQGTPEDIASAKQWKKKK